jgi:hypothetical protein
MVVAVVAVVAAVGQVDREGSCLLEVQEDHPEVFGTVHLQPEVLLAPDCPVD